VTATAVRAVRWLAALALASLAACSMLPAPSPAPSPVPPAQPQPPAARPESPAVRPSPPAARPGRPGPIADRAISLHGQCAQTEDDGFREQAELKVRDNEVQALSWQLWVGRRGSCRFEQADFQQTRRRPHIELQSRDGSGCKLMVWQDPRRITLAHAGCQRWCTAGIYDQAMPVMFDPGSGGCARP